MRWRILGIKGKLRSPRNENSRISRLIRDPGKSDVGVSPYSYANQDQESRKILNPTAYIVANQRINELEGQKAFLMKVSRHESWKAGGPY